jgi:hypothetical protein
LLDQSGTSFKVESYFVAKSSVSFWGRKIIFRFYDPQETHAGLLLSFLKIQNKFSLEKAKTIF